MSEVFDHSSTGYPYGEDHPPAYELSKHFYFLPESAATPALWYKPECSLEMVKLKRKKIMSEKRLKIR